MIGIQLYEKDLVQIVDDLTPQLTWEVIHEYEDCGTRMMVVVNSECDIKTIAFNSLEWNWKIVKTSVDLNIEES